MLKSFSISFVSLLIFGLVSVSDAKCGCASCTQEILDRDANGYPCGGRINWVVANTELDETGACAVVAGEEFPSVCGDCDPNTCDLEETQRPSLRPTAVPTPLPSSQPANPTAVPIEPTKAPVNPPEDAKCGCASCTREIQDRNANGYPCGSRIDWVVNNEGLSEYDACALVGGEEFPSICGPCDPNTCSDDTSRPTEPPINPTTAPVEPTAPIEPETVTPTPDPKCGCESCTEEVLDRIANGFRCGGRIDWLINNGATENDACSQVGGEEYPSICGLCDPNTCDQIVDLPETPIPSLRATAAPVALTSSPVAPSEAPFAPTPNAPPTIEPKCGCSSCTQDVLDRNANGYSCGGRINWLINNEGFSEADACASVAGSEYPYICGGCDPNTCNYNPTYSVAHLGNSIQYYNDAPRVLEKMLLSTVIGRNVDLDEIQERKAVVDSESCLRGGSNIASLWDSGNGMASKFAIRPQSIIPGDNRYDIGAPTVRDLLRHHWDFVVINDHTQHPVRSSRQPQSIAALQTKHLPAIAETLESTALASNGDATTTVIFLQTMAYRTPVKNSGDLGSFDDFTRKLEDGYDEYVRVVKSYNAERFPDENSRTIKATVAPLGRAYQIVRDEYYDLWNTALYAYDDFHPSPHGTLLEACILHCTITGQPFSFFGSDDSMEAYWRFARRVQNQRLPSVAEAEYLNDVAYRVCLEQVEKEDRENLFNE